MDIDSFAPLVDFKFNSPTLEVEDNPTFGSLLACVNIALKMIYKVDYCLELKIVFFAFRTTANQVLMFQCNIFRNK